jgi:Zn-dependent protease with chaperone function
MMASARLLGLVLVLLSGTSCSSLSAAPVVDPAGVGTSPTRRPATDTDEGGLWMLADRAEKELHTSPLLVRDAALTAHVAAVTCRVAGPRCPEIRPYVLRGPRAEASMAPNGALVVSTGVLLRTLTEDQLAYVLAHEVAHYVGRHGLLQWRDLRSRAIAAHILGNLASLGSLAWLGAPGFSREQEAEADRVALDLMVRAGYDGRHAAAFLEGWLAEETIARPERRSTTHPPTASRLSAARIGVARLEAVSRGPIEPGAHGRATEPWLARFLRDDLQRREFAASLALAERLLADGILPAEVHFFQGEVYRLRGEESDDVRAVAALTRALEADRPPVAAHRALGLIHMRRGNGMAARIELARYLAARPDAEDRSMIEVYLTRLEGGAP